MASNHHSFEDFATAVAWEAGKLLVMERVKVAPPKAMEMRIKSNIPQFITLNSTSAEGTFTSSEYIVVHSGRLSKIKPLAQLDKVCILSCAIPTGLGSPLNVAKRKIILSCCLLASLLLKVEKFLRRQSIGVESGDLKPKRFHEAKEKTETSTSAEAPDRTNCR